MEFDHLFKGLRIRLLSNGITPEYEGIVVHMSEEDVDIRWRDTTPGSVWLGAMPYSRGNFETFKDKVVGPKTTKTFKDLL